VGDTTTISWSQRTYNPLSAVTQNGQKDRWSCVKISEACRFCYASTLNARFGGSEYPWADENAGNPIVPVRLNEKLLLQPLTKAAWRKPAMVFASSMTDLFGRWVPWEWLDKVYAVMALSPWNTYQVLTKRPTEMHEYVTHSQTPARVVEMARELLLAHRGSHLHSWPGWPLPNVWAGVSVETDRYVWRAAVLATIPAPVRFISAEPLLGPLDAALAPMLTATPCPDCVGIGYERQKIWDPFMEEYLQRRSSSRCGTCGDAPSPTGTIPPPIHWVIIGGESAGPAERRLVTRCLHWGRGLDHPGDCSWCWGSGWEPIPEKLGWVRNLVDLCTANGVAVHLKQWGGPRPDSAGHLLDGEKIHQWPHGFTPPGGG
jgi:protein gp37